MEHDGLDIHAFQRWAMGNLVENRNRGIFAEWLVGQALGAIGLNEYRQEWDAWDLLYGASQWKVEVKAAGYGQTWPQDQPSVPRFDIAPKERTWDPSTADWIKNDRPTRPADLYVFCLHTPEEATNENVLDPDCWQFWVLSSRKLDQDQDLRQQKSVGLAKLKSLTASTSGSELPAAVDRCIQHLRVDSARPVDVGAERVLLIRLGSWHANILEIESDTYRTGAGYREGMTLTELVDATRAWWRINPGRVEREGIRHAVAVHQGITRAVMVIGDWIQRADGRWAFSASPLTDGPVHDAWVGPYGRKIDFPKGNQNPIAYWPPR